jgi:hypothetical protein
VQARRIEHIHGMNSEQGHLILSILQRLPQWIRHDLAGKDDNTRLRAEESLAAMIADALVKNEAE